MPVLPFLVHDRGFYVALVRLLQARRWERALMRNFSGSIRLSDAHVAVHGNPGREHRLQRKHTATYGIVLTVGALALRYKCSNGYDEGGMKMVGADVRTSIPIIPLLHFFFVGAV